MKFYPKKYDDFYGDKIIKEMDVSQVKGNIYDSNEYLKKLKELTSGYFAAYFDFIVKFHWLARSFEYKGMNRLKGKVVPLDIRYGVYMRWIVGVDFTFITNNQLFLPIASYLPDFFPNFFKRNPFEEKMEYPYKYMNLDCLLLVADMDERLELLEYGENKKYSLVQFSNFVMNYTLCLNEEGKKYGIIRTVPGHYYKINKIKIYEQPKAN